MAMIAISFLSHHIFFIVWFVGTLAAYRLCRAVNRNSNDEYNYTYSHVFCNFFFSLASWVAFVVCGIMWLSDSKYRNGNGKPPSWL